MVHRDRLNHRRQRALAIGTSLAGITAGAAIYARFVEPATLLVREIDLETPALPASLDGMKIAFLSDMHLGGPAEFRTPVHQAMDTLHQASPDIIMLGGDYFDRGVRAGSEPTWAEFPVIAPTFAVPGNHDYRGNPTNSSEIFSVLREAGIVVLRNESTSVPVRDSRISLIGLDDPYSERDDVHRAIRRNSDLTAFRVMLAHAGLVADRLPIDTADLILSGHTHGAQIRVSPFRRAGPLDIFWWLDRLKGNPLSPYRQGLFRVRGSLLYVGNGLGTTTVGARFLAPPELALFTLFSGKGNPELQCDDPRRYIRQVRNSRKW